MLIRAAIHVGGRLRGLLLLVLAVGIIVLAAGLGGAWRLAQGPLDVGWAARRIEAAFNLPDSPTLLTIGHATIRWNAYADGAGQGLELLLRDVRLRDAHQTGPAARPIADVDRLAVTVSMARLLLGEVVPRAITVSGLNLSLLRDAAGDVSLDLGGLTLSDDTGGDGASGPTLRTTLAELARPARLPGARPKRPDLQHIEELASVRINASVLHLHDPALGSAIRVDIMSLDLQRQARGGVHGTAAAAIALGGAHDTVAVHADLAPNGGTQVQIAFSLINATDVQSAEPALATADVLDAAVQGAATLQLDGRLRPVGAALQLDAGGGRMRVADGVIGFDSLSVRALAAWDHGPGAPDWGLPEHLVLQRAKAVVHAPGGAWPTTLTASGNLNQTAEGYSGDAQGTIDHLNFADIGALWPKALGGHIRPWLVPNVTGGVVRDGAIKASFKAPADFSDIELTAIDATAKGEDVTIWWLRPVPPVEAAQAVLTMNNPQVLDIAVSSARQGTLALTNGLIHFTGMSEKDQFLALSADIAGGVPELMTLLANPTLQLLSRSPIPIHNPAGTMKGHLGVNMPMKDVVEFEDIRIQTTARATGLHLGAVVAGRDLDRGTIQVDASTDAFHAGGKATLGGIPSDLTFDMDFHDGPPSQVLERASATARASGQQLARAGLDPGGLMPSGTGVFTGKYLQRRDGSGQVTVSADLQDAALALPGWTKAPGQPGDLAARLMLRGDQMTGIEQLHAHAPGLVVDGRVGMVGDQPLLLELDRLVVGQTQAKGQLQFAATPSQPIRATLSGPMLDLSALKKDADPAKTKDADPAMATPAKPGPPWIADLRFDRVQTAAGQALTAVVAHAEDDGSHVAAMTLTTGGAEQIQASIRKEGSGRRLLVKAADAGAMLRAADVVKTIQGGHLSLDATYDDRVPSSPLSGTAELTDFTVRDAPALGKLLQALTIYGVVDAMRGPGLVFTDAVIPFRWDAGVLQLLEARAFSSSLGLTARGTIDTNRNTLELQGTVVPAYVLNSLLGRLPLIGRLFSAEKGGGLLAVGYGLSGPMANAAVSVNPLSALTPGFLRGLFHIFG
jgi:hypothetical protein